MAGRKSERLKILENRYMELRQKGYSIAEIAKECGLSPFTVYKALDSIAEKEGVTRDSLLYVVHKPHELKNVRSYLKQPIINPEELKQDFQSLLKDVDTIINKIDFILQEER